MKTSWLKVLDQHLGYKPDPEKWAYNTALAKKFKYHILCVLKGKYGTPVQRRAVFELLEWLEVHKPIPPAPQTHLEGLLEWIESHPRVDYSYTEGNDRHGGQYIPTTISTYVIQGRTFIVSTYPDWDNYQTDSDITMDGLIVSLLIN